MIPGMTATAHSPVDWSAVHTVFLDMDGTLLDLYFDNHFWIEHVPLRWGEQRGMTLEQAKQALHPRFKALEGTLNWYCVDHWSRELEMDILALKRELQHLIGVLPDVPQFLRYLRSLGKRIVLLTNAHGDVLELKMELTELRDYFDVLISSHQLGLPKEGPGFWDKLQSLEPFEPRRALLMDDSLRVLRAAHRAGIGQLVAMRRPDSRYPAREIDEFPAVTRLGELLSDQGSASK